MGRTAGTLADAVADHPGSAGQDRRGRPLPHDGYGVSSPQDARGTVLPDLDVRGAMTCGSVLPVPYGVSRLVPDLSAALA
ncbi:hypothetical protein [Kineococcus aurantiacus]|uniref:Uncharacterized protein n=1 Tax=Kineococcus aurantiacus TaxID=37633 RepID=A0A7Y9DNE0_9ACTN|nr:hypothetical protein [Kineococcus aurantiacus]NYD23815.1 hypothetical protein [Kineococcus aurantiacus]